MSKEGVLFEGGKEDKEEGRMVRWGLKMKERHMSKEGE